MCSNIVFSAMSKTGDVVMLSLKIHGRAKAEERLGLDVNVTILNILGLQYAV